MPQDSRPQQNVADIRVREAQPGDLDDLVKLEKAAFRSDRLTRRRFASHVRSTTADLVVARHEKELAGYALVLTRRGSRVARLYSLAVADAWRGRGLGSHLLAMAQSRAAQNNATAFRLEVRADNSAAVNLYESRGYRLVGREEDYYADGAPALRYEIGLSDAPSPAEARPPRLGRAA
jgi:ribosomal-protein-alanine acetyltransferase